MKDLKMLHFDQKGEMYVIWWLKKKDLKVSVLLSYILFYLYSFQILVVVKVQNFTEGITNMCICVAK